MSERHFLEQLNDDLALALGRAIWAFARIEREIFRLLHDLSSDRINELVPHLQFVQRADVLIRMVNRDEKNDRRQRAITALQTVKGLAERRNLIAHNPWNIAVDFENRKIVSKISKLSNPDMELSVEGLSQFVEECNAARQELLEAVAAYRFSSAGLGR